MENLQGNAGKAIARERMQSEVQRFMVGLDQFAANGEKPPAYAKILATLRAIASADDDVWARHAADTITQYGKAGHGEVRELLAHCLKYGAPPKAGETRELALTDGGQRLSKGTNPGGYVRCAENVLTLVVITISSAMSAKAELEAAEAAHVRRERCYLFPRDSTACGMLDSSTTV